MTAPVRRLVLVLLGIVLALGAAELIFRAASPIRAEQLLPRPYRRDDLRRIAAGETYIQFDQELGWSVKPGTVQPAGSHCTAPCVHWGLLRGETYLDPLSVLPPWLLRGGPSRLLPVLGVPPPS